MSTLYKIAGVQMDVALGQLDQNLTEVTAKLQQAAANGAKLVVLPECVVSGYCFENLEEAAQYAQPVPGPATQTIAEHCRELNVFAVFGMLEADGDRVFNACVLVGPDGVVGSYRKTHLPYLGVDRFTTPGDRPFAVHDAGGLRIGMQICYDGSFPEPSRIMALAGADLIVLPTNWPPGAQCTADFVVNARAMENHVFFMAVNRVGQERGFRFVGRSKICDVFGTPLAEALHEEPAILYAEIDPQRARNKHIARVPGKHEIDRFKDRRPDLYGPLVAPVDSR